MNIKPNYIKCSKEDFDEGLKIFLDHKNEGAKSLIKNIEDSGIKHIVFNIKKIVDKYLAGKVPEDVSIGEFKNILEDILLKSDDLANYGLVSKVNEIYNKHSRNGECDTCPSYLMDSKIKEYYELLQKSPLIMFNWSPEEGYEVKDVTKNVIELTGYSHEDFLKNKLVFNDIIHPEDIERINSEVKKYTQELLMTEFEQKYRILTKDGVVKNIFDKTLVKYDEDGNIINLYGFIYDITHKTQIEGEIKSNSDKLNFLLTHDEKSGLPNQFQCKEDIEENNIEHLIVFKIREFDKINSLFGREGGEEVLEQIIEQYKLIINEFEDINAKLYRLSSTEFGITLNPGNFLHINPHEIITQLHNLLKDITIEYKGVNLPINNSIGAKFYSEEGSLLNKAQVALEEAKKRDGDEKIIIYTPGLDEKLSLKYNGFYSWINKIKDTLEKQLNNEEGNLKVYYQGIVDNTTGEMDKFESLIRYEEDETKTVVSPFHFLDHVKQGRLISQLTKVVLLDNLKVLKENSDISISINFTMEDLKNVELLNFLIDEVKNSKINPNRITLEILEDISIIGDEIYNDIENLKNEGFQISIDDFGTGYSNFERLIKIKPDYIKIDGSLIKGILNSKEKGGIVQSIVTMAHGLGAKVIAEYVDSLEVQEKLIEYGVDYSQGFYFAEPKPFKEYNK